jgi:hypothetical protein
VRINSSRNQKGSLILVVERNEAQKIYAKKNRIGIRGEQNGSGFGWVGEGYKSRY